jgi:transcriptional regulator with AAA-type ATPase domain
MPALQLRQEFQTRHMRDTAIELSNGENTGLMQRKDSTELLEITYPTADVRRALEAVSLNTAGKPIVMMGQRGSGKSHIMALVHHAFGSPNVVESWASSWGQKLQADKAQRSFCSKMAP